MRLQCPVLLLLTLATALYSLDSREIKKRPFQIMPIDVSVQAKVGPFNIFISFIGF